MRIQHEDFADWLADKHLDFEIDEPLTFWLGLRHGTVDLELPDWAIEFERLARGQQMTVREALVALDQALRLIIERQSEVREEISVT